MKVFIQNKLCPSQVLFAFNEVTNRNIRRIRWAVAYATQRGCTRLVSHIAARIGSRQWSRTDKTFVTSMDYGMTEPASVRFLIAQPNSRVLFANADAPSRRGFMPIRAYHPKIYLFDERDLTGYVVGSANLTESALIRNTEVVLAGFEVPENNIWDDAWNSIVDSAVEVTEQLLSDYENQWRRPRPRPVEPEPTPPPPPVPPGERPAFGDEFTAGRVFPNAFTHFWVEAGSMSSGGSHNQLELPRCANVFFGFRFSDYGSDHRIIGHPAITLRQRCWTDRPLTWHGNNRMERINLPTRLQGGFDYQNTAILFRRHEHGFELSVTPWDDAEAFAWRAASDAIGTVFNLGERGPRVCGLF